MAGDGGGGALGLVKREVCCRMMAEISLPSAKPCSRV